MCLAFCWLFWMGLNDNNCVRACVQVTHTHDRNFFDFGGVSQQPRSLSAMAYIVQAHAKDKSASDCSSNNVKFEHYAGCWCAWNNFWCIVTIHRIRPNFHWQKQNNQICSNVTPSRGSTHKTHHYRCWLLSISLQYAQTHTPIHSHTNTIYVYMWRTLSKQLSLLSILRAQCFPIQINIGAIKTTKTTIAQRTRSARLI